MKSLSGVFLVLIVGVHSAGGPRDLVGTPLSMLRDGELRVFGYGLFVLLLLLGVLMVVASVRAHNVADAGVFGLAAVLLAGVAATPSTDVVHGLCSLTLMGLLYVYLGLLLYAADSPWLVVHLAVPSVLALATGFHSYGLLQKGMIVYFVLALNVRFFVLSRQRPGRPAARRGPRTERDAFGKRRVVFVIEPGKTWQRRR